MQTVGKNAMRALRKDGLGRHLAIIVIVKLVVLTALWFAFFRSSAPLDSQHVGDAILRQPVPASSSYKE